MKKVFILVTLVTGMFFLMSFVGFIQETEKTEIVSQSSYSNGWADGYCEGWKDVKGQYSICPVTPIAPIPEIGKDTYRGGYNRGFKKGRYDANNN